jgi:hypothetical protein
MKTALTLFALLLFSLCVWSQSPSISFMGTLGKWREWVNYEDAYSNNYPKWRPFAAVGGGITFPIGTASAFSPEAGLEYYDFRYIYRNTHSSMTIISKLGMFFTRISPGFTFGKSEGIFVRMAIAFQVSSGAFGSYSIKTYTQYQNDTVHYTDRFHLIRNVGSIGPEISTGFNLPLESGGKFGLRITAFRGQHSILMPTFRTPHNPRTSRINLELVYTLPPIAKNTEGNER